MRIMTNSDYPYGRTIRFLTSKSIKRACDVECGEFSERSRQRDAGAAFPGAAPASSEPSFPDCPTSTTATAALAVRTAFAAFGSHDRRVILLVGAFARLRPYGQRLRGRQHYAHRLRCRRAGGGPVHRR